MLTDFEPNTPESDRTHLSDVLQNFDEQNARELFVALGMTVLAAETAWPYHIFPIARMI